MKDKPEFSRKRIEETAKAADIISRARAAAPISAGLGRDVLLGHGLGTTNMRSSRD